MKSKEAKTESSYLKDKLIKQVAVKYGYSSLFDTPQNLLQIQELINYYSISDQEHLRVVFGMTCNFYSGIIAELIADQGKKKKR